MSYQPKPIEVVILWSLAVKIDGAFQKDVKPQLDKKKREALAHAGLIDVKQLPPPKGGRKQTYVSLSDAGWRWISEHPDAEMSTRTPAAASILRDFILLVHRYCADQSQSLIHIFRPPQRNGPTKPPEPESIRAAILHAYLAMTNGQQQVRVRLADLRRQLGTYTRDQVDAGLHELMKMGKAVLYALDDPTEIQADDREAAVRTASGEPRHLIYLTGEGH